MTVKSQSGDVLTYHQREDQIHSFILHEDSTEAVDEFIRILEGIYANLHDHAYVYLLIDLTEMAAGPPLRTIVKRMKPFFDNYPDRAPGSLAIVTRQGSVLTLISNFLKLFSRSRDRFHFFKDGEQEKAINWLLAGE